MIQTALSYLSPLQNLAFPFTLRRSCSRSAFLFIRIHLIYYILLISVVGISHSPASATECVKRKYYELTITFSGIRLNQNRTMKCDMYFQWTVADYCCFDKYDRYEDHPYCCYSETYKLVLAAGFICLVLLSSAFTIFFCWVYNLPHHLLHLLTCGKFHLNNWLARNKNGPYVDPSFYSGEPFWARGAEMQLYPLRPMPPKIFYPAPPTKLKYRWDANGEIPLFVVASRQFTRNPYSARPQDRSSSGHHGSGGGHSQGQISTISTGSTGFLGSISESRRSSLSSNHGGVPGGGGGGGGGSCGVIPESPKHSYNRRESNSVPNGPNSKRGSSSTYRDPQPFTVNIDETEAAAELMQAVNSWNSPDSNGDDDCIGDTGGINKGNVGAATTSTTSRSEEPIRTRASTSTLTMIRPNTTGSSEYLNNHNSRSSILLKPNVEALNHQLSSLGMPVYNMPGVHTPDVVSTVQNYHVVSSNLGNPMETILEDDSYDEEINPKELKKPKNKNPPSKTENPKTKPSLKRRATIEAATPSQKQQNPKPKMRVSSAVDHLLVGASTPPTAHYVPFNPTLPGSLAEEVGGSRVMDTEFVDDETVKSNQNPGKSEPRRNSVI